MITKESLFRKAFELKRDARLKRQNERELMLSAAYAAKPRLAEIDRELSGIGARIALTAVGEGSTGLETLKKRSAALTLEKNLLLRDCRIPEEKQDCPLCGDTGYLSNGKICGCVKEIAKGLAAQELSHELPLAACTFESFDLKYYQDVPNADGENPRRRMTAILKLCREYCIGFTPKTAENLLFLGQPGLGKTHLSLAIVNEVLLAGYLPVYSSAESLFQRMEKERFSGGDQTLYDTVLHCDLLVIDDLGTEIITTVTKSLLYNVINTRMLSSMPTVINTNLNLSELERAYSARITSRIIGAYNCNKLIGSDIRQQKVICK